uniref:Myb/SANT-like DNA-binding domain-containing protein n=1 Tax=Timema shepardi TaxID=629360 RepID=A0A7R9AX27_TIMSH|nr:unnamed protein product [Timema shepardi]
MHSKSPRRPDLRYFIKAENLSEHVPNTGKNEQRRFICNVYNVGHVIDVDAARLQMFIDSYTVSDVNEAFDRKKLRNFDASNLPPCKIELLQQFRRANYICTIWNNAHLKNPTIYQPNNNGWVLENDKYHFKWFEGDQLPSYVSDSLKTQSETDGEGDIDDDQATDWSSSDEDNENIDDKDENHRNDLKKIYMLKREWVDFMHPPNHLIWKDETGQGAKVEVHEEDEDVNYSVTEVTLNEETGHLMVGDEEIGYEILEGEMEEGEVIPDDHRYNVIADGESYSTKGISEQDYNDGNLGETSETLKLTWTRGVIRILIEEYRKLWPLFLNPHNKQKNVWMKLAKNMGKHGYLLTWDMCSRKWRNLRQTFKCIHEKQKYSQPNRGHWEFYETLKDFFLVDRHPKLKTHPTDTAQFLFKPRHTFADIVDVPTSEGGSIVTYPDVIMHEDNNLQTTGNTYFLNTTESQADNIHLAAVDKTKSCDSIPPWLHIFMDQIRSDDAERLGALQEMHEEVLDMEKRKYTCGQMERYLTPDSSHVSYLCLAMCCNFCNVERLFWTERNTKSLIQEYMKLLKLFRDPRCKQKDLWSKVSRNMRQNGVDVTANMCDRKWLFICDDGYFVNDDNVVYQVESSDAVNCMVDPISGHLADNSTSQMEEMPVWFQNFIEQYRLDENNKLAAMKKMHSELMELEVLEHTYHVAILVTHELKVLWPSSPMASLVLTNSSQLTSESQHLGIPLLKRHFALAALFDCSHTPNSRCLLGYDTDDITARIGAELPIPPTRDVLVINQPHPVLHPLCKSLYDGVWQGLVLARSKLRIPHLLLGRRGRSPWSTLLLLCYTTVLCFLKKHNSLLLKCTSNHLTLPDVIYPARRDVSSPIAGPEQARHWCFPNVVAVFVVFVAVVRTAATPPFVFPELHSLAGVYLSLLLVAPVTTLK